MQEWIAFGIGAVIGPLALVMLIQAQKEYQARKWYKQIRKVSKR